jgi:hypothetical protein
VNCGRSPADAACLLTIPRTWKLADDHFSDGDRLSPDAAFKKPRRDIEGLARRKYFLGQREPDGSVLIRSEEIA